MRRDEKQRLIAAFNNLKRRNAVQECLALKEHCPARVIRAHSLQGTFVLDRLAEDGHVYMFRREVDRFRLALEGRNEATTFTGFCHSHDSELFREVDFDGSRRFDPESMRQLVLLSLRAAAREYWAKLNARRLYQRLVRFASERNIEAIRRELNLPSLHQTDLASATDEVWKPLLIGIRGATSRLQRLFLSLYSQVQRDRFHLTLSRVFSIHGAATVAVASAFAPEFDLEGQQLNTLRLETDPTDVVLSILPEDARTYVVFTFHKRHAPVLEPFFDQIVALDEQDLKYVLSKMVIMHCENTTLSPRLVNGLTPEERRRLENLFGKTIFQALPYDQVPDLSLF